jgi:hypothetical protein
MGFWWFGRKSAPPDMRPFVPAWLSTAEAEEGFARSAEGMIAYIRSDGVWATYRAGAWETGAVRGSNLILDGQQVVGGRAAAIASPSGGTTIDSEARLTIDQLLAAMRQHGLIET